MNANELTKIARKYASSQGFRPEELLGEIWLVASDGRERPPITLVRTAATNLRRQYGNGQTSLEFTGGDATESLSENPAENPPIDSLGALLPAGLTTQERIACALLAGGERPSVAFRMPERSAYRRYAKLQNKLRMLAKR